MGQIFFGVMSYISIAIFIFLIGSFFCFFISQLTKELWGMSKIERKVFTSDFIHTICETCIFLALMSCPFLFLMWGLS
jgi:hypothetical protein